MARSFLFFALAASLFYSPFQSMPGPRQPLFTEVVFARQQNDFRLSRQQIEEFLKTQDDEVVAAEILKSGIKFRVTVATLEQLVKLKAGPQTQRALLQREARAAYEEFSNEKDPATRLNFGKAILNRHPDSPEAAKVRAELRKIELEVFESVFQSYSSNPQLAGLGQVFKLGDELLRQYPDRATEIQIKSRLALAASKGVMNNFYRELEQSLNYANQALRLLENDTPPPDVDQQTYQKLRASSLGAIYQSLGLYQLLQTALDSEKTPDLEQAIVYLTKAAELKDSLSARDPITYLLRARARKSKFDKLSDDYRALPKAQRAGRQG